MNLRGFKITPDVTLQCYSFAPYPKKGALKQDALKQHDDPQDAAIQRFTYAIKNGGTVTDLQNVDWDVYEYLAREVSPHEASLGKTRVLVPIPGHGITNASTVCAGHRIANALRAKGHGSAVANVFTRTTAVARAATAKAKGLKRPTVQEHQTSLAVDRQRLQGITEITLIDDALTSGTQLVGALLALRAAGFTGNVLAFTASHTLEGVNSAREWHHRGPITWHKDKPYARRTSV